VTPKVSICVPNLNTRPFLPERFQTIQAQSLNDWELLVYDSHSTDGAWEYISELAAGEPRMRAWQGPREGTPGSWSPCVAQARGEYVYIATSDDTMPPDCLEKLVAALDAHPDCDVAHCRLMPIDGHGNEMPTLSKWWSTQSVFALSSGPLLDRSHIRRAPFDGLLHLSGRSVYISITQLLIRRSLFDRVGLFESTWGSVGDFNWSMRAGLAASTVHVPDTWGGWRLHAAQATAGAGLGSPEHAKKIDAMIENAIEKCSGFLPPSLQSRLESRCGECHDLRTFERELVRRSNPFERRAYVLRRMLSGSVAAKQHVQERLLAEPRWLDQFSDRVQRWLQDAGVGPALRPTSIAHPL